MYTHTLYTRDRENELFASYSNVRWIFPYILQNILPLDSTDDLISFLTGKTERLLVLPTSL